MYKIFKWWSDKFAAIIILIILLPIILIIFLLLLISLKGNPFFYQLRPGKNEKIFGLYKFRTMSNDKDSNGNLLSDDRRLTYIGKYIRGTSLDELPQMFNVLKGDMSFVGPRPLLPEYLPLYSDKHALRHNVKPGITGWAQVNGRNSINWEKKFDLDVWYVENQSLLLDLKILWLTILKVLKRDGISSKTSATMEKFTGSK